MADADYYARFRRAAPIIVGGVHTYGTWKRPSWLVKRPAVADIHLYQVGSETEGRPDRIAFEIYGAAELYWVLIAFNQVMQPLGWPRTGLTIEYPDDSIVIPEL